MQNLSNLVNL